MASVSGPYWCRPCGWNDKNQFLSKYLCISFLPDIMVIGYGMQQMEPLVFVVVLNWNRRSDTLGCIESLISQDYTNLKIIVVDNASTDDSVEAIRGSYPQVPILVNDSNLGYSRGNNIGIQYALDQDADFVLLLNNDAIADAELVRQMVAVMEDAGSIGVTGPKILYYDEPQRIWSAGGVLNFTETVSRMRGYRQMDRGQFDRMQGVDFVSGCAMLLRREALETVGLLDPIYSPAYFEDLDWCTRARKMGFRVVYIPEAKVWHQVSMSGGGEYNPMERYLLGFNSILFMKRYARLSQWVKFVFFAVGSLPFVFLVRLLQGRGRAVGAKAVGLLDGIKGIQRSTYLA